MSESARHSSQIELSHLEREVMLRLLDGDDEVVTILRRQFAAASIVRQEATGTGFSLYFSLPVETERLKSHPTFSFGDIQAMIPGLTFGAGFVLHVRNGAIEFLEGYSYEEPWPESVSSFVLRTDEGLSDIKADTLREIIKKMHSAATA